MRQKIFILLAHLLCLYLQATAQPFANTRNNRADATFNLCEPWCINHRHKAWIGSGNTMMVEMSNIAAYSRITDLESLLQGIIDDLAFVRDSIAECPQCNFRIDYATTSPGMKEYRLRKYQPKGTFLYQKKGGELLPYKPEADTLHILLGNEIKGREWFDKFVQLEFVVNRFANLDSLLAQKGRLNAMIDTMRLRAAPKHRRESRPYSGYRTTINLYRYGSDTSRMLIDFSRGLHKEGAFLTNQNVFDVQVAIGGGFLRDRIVPVAEGGFFYRFPGPLELLMGLYTSGYFAFAKDADDGSYKLQDNWFVNAEFGNEGEEDFISNIKRSRLTFGLGYLASQKGDYFKGATMKAFMNIRLMNGITLTPEVIATDNFRQVFPGFTVKIF